MLYDLIGCRETREDIFPRGLSTKVIYLCSYYSLGLSIYVYSYDKSVLEELVKSKDKREKWTNENRWSIIILVNFGLFTNSLYNFEKKKYMKYYNGCTSWCGGYNSKRGKNKAKKKEKKM